MVNKMKLYYSEINVHQDHNAWSINTSKTIHLDTQTYFFNFCNYIFELLSGKVCLLATIDKEHFDENILDEISYNSDLEIFSAKINEIDNIKNITFDSDGHKINIKICPPYKIILEAI